MQPNQPMPGPAMQPVAAPSATNNPFESNPMAQAPQAAQPASSAKKGGKGALIGMVLLGLIAAGGVGFGVWTMMDSSNQTKSLNSQINNLKQQNSTLLEKVTELEETLSKYQNNTPDTPDTPTEDETVEAEILEGVFYVKDANGETLAQSEINTVTELVSCETKTDETSSEKTMTCTVTTSDGQGTFVYDYTAGSLVFTTAAVEVED